MAWWNCRKTGRSCGAPVSSSAVRSECHAVEHDNPLGGRVHGSDVFMRVVLPEPEGPMMRRPLAAAGSRGHVVEAVAVDRRTLSGSAARPWRSTRLGRPRAHRPSGGGGVGVVMVALILRAAESAGSTAPVRAHGRGGRRGDSEDGAGDRAEEGSGVQRDGPGGTRRWR